MFSGGLEPQTLLPKTIIEIVQYLTSFLFYLKSESRFLKEPTKRCTFQLCGHFECASLKYMLCGTFFHRCYSWTRFLVVFSVVLVETKSTAEFFSTISTLILNVHGSKSRSQLKSSTIFKTVSTFDF